MRTDITNVTKRLRVFFLALVSFCLFSFPAFAAEIEGSYGTTDQGVYGWAWHKGHFGDILTVKVLFYYDDMSKPKKALSLTADQYNKNVEDTIGDGWHYFEAKVDWDSLGGKPKKVLAYAVYNDDWIGIGASASKSIASQTSDSAKSSSGASGQSASGKSSSSNPEKTGSASSSPAGPGEVKAVPDKKGKSLGSFSVTGYCTCEKCIIGQGLTYSGKKPTGNHTIAADLSLFPLGTKLMIDDVIYTVEDTGGGMVGNHLDIYFDTHAGAVNFGRQTKEVFEVVE